MTDDQLEQLIRADVEKIADVFASPESTPESGEIAELKRQIAELRRAIGGSSRPSTPTYVPWIAAAVLAVAFLSVGGVAVSQASAISELRTRVDELDVQLERSGVRTAMIASVSASGRSTVRAQGSWDTRYVSGATLTIGDRVLELSGRSAADPSRLVFDETVEVELDGRNFEAVLEFQPAAGVYESLPTFFGPDRRFTRRRFKASRAGLITDPEEITVPAEIDQLVNARDYKDPTKDVNAHVVAGQVYEEVEGMHGWLIIHPVLASNKFVGSRLSLDGSRFLARCFLGNDDLDHQQYRVFCVFHRDPDVLRDGQEILPDFDWEDEGFVVSPSRFKVNDGDDGFDPEPGRE